jgi:hypothetical protein
MTTATASREPRRAACAGGDVSSIGTNPAGGSGRDGSGRDGSGRDGSGREGGTRGGGGSGSGAAAEAGLAGRRDTSRRIRRASARCAGVQYVRRGSTRSSIST